MTDIKVTVLCIAYNHEKYIRQCLESLVTQKTNFRYKVVVHDDASTDSTADIIREFEQKYPEIIKPIYQTENQFSKKLSIYKEFLLPKIEGDYVAFCEGDDYWTDINKLQIQSDFLDKHPGCSACGHNTTIIKESEAAKNAAVPDIIGGNEGYLSLKTIVEWGLIIHLSSIMFRSKFADFPDFVYTRYDLLDMPMTIYLRFCGDIYRFEKIMSAYRFMVANSWSEKASQNSAATEGIVEIAVGNLLLPLRANEYSKSKYKSAFAAPIIANCLNFDNAKDLIYVKYREFYELLKPDQKTKIDSLLNER
jgi:glycosyltransferase involved in cell wall biosynthesis